MNSMNHQKFTLLALRISRQRALGGIRDFQKFDHSIYTISTSLEATEMSELLCII
jgi:hypothetical protein